MNKVILFIFILVLSCQNSAEFDTIIRNGTIIDGSGRKGIKADIGFNADTIAFIGDLSQKTADHNIDATGQIVSPGFINMLSWATTSLIHDGRSQSDIRQGVTLEVFGEGESNGPLSAQAKKELIDSQGEIKYEVPWTTLGEYLQYLEDKGISTNVASFVGATTLRTSVIGYEDRDPTEAELEKMKQLTHQAMQEGALGIGSSLIYAPAFYAKTTELIELSKVAAQYNGMYISHLRSEANRLIESLDELITIAQEANIRAEVYHLKQAGQSNWHKLDLVIDKINNARKSGLEISANMYNYVAGATGLDAAMPPWVQEGGYKAWVERLKDPSIRKKVIKEMIEPAVTWESLMQAAGDPKNMILIGFKNPKLQKFTGMRLSEVAEMMKLSPEETAIELVIQDGSRVDVVYFLMSEDNVKKQITLPWMSFCSDAGSYTNEGVVLKSSQHPRAYGNFARLFAKYVRDEKVISVEEAVHKLTYLPAQNLKIKKRGLLKPGYYADVVIFNQDSIQDHATFENPHQYSTGVSHVFVNGMHILKDGNHTGAFGGRFVKGPGYKNH